MSNPPWTVLDSKSNFPTCPPCQLRESENPTQYTVHTMYQCKNISQTRVK